MKSSTHHTDFFVTGGTIKINNPSYVTRLADDQLMQLTKTGEYCYVLASRQMGKSSLMVRTAKLLQEQDIRAAIIDLNAIGTCEYSAQNWYFSLLYELIYALDLDINLDDWWSEHASLTLIQRLVNFLRDVVLQEISERIVIFIDEIDTTLKMDFSDDFFAATRALYNARSTEAELNRLTFVFIGVATPTDLINDPTRTPFNIGHRIEMTDFTLEEARPLANGFKQPSEQAQQILEWVFNWTGGHPYLTQRLCKAIVDINQSNITKADIDNVVANTFLGQMSKQDDNLQFVRDMLINDTQDLSGTISTYKNIFMGLMDIPDMNSSLITHLKLSGVVVQDNGQFRIRNLIYKTEFNQTWIEEIISRERIGDQIEFEYLKALANKQKEQLDIKQQLAEEQLESSKKLKKIIRFRTNLAIFSAIITILLFYFAFQSNQNRLQAQNAENTALREKELAIKNAEEASRQAKIATSRQLAAQALTHINDLDLALLLGIEASQLTQSDEVIGSLLTSLTANPYLITYLHDHSGRIESVDFSPDGKLLASGSYDGAVILWDVEKGSSIDQPLLGHSDKVLCVKFSPDGKILASSGADFSIILWDVATMEPIANLKTHRTIWIHSIAFSPNGKLLASSTGMDEDDEPVILIWDIETHQPIGDPLTKHQDEIQKVLFSPDGNIMASASRDKSIILWDVETWQPIGQTLLGHNDWVWDLAFSPDGKTLASSSYDSSIIFWDVEKRQPIGQPIFEKALIITSIAFSPDGKYLISGGGSRNIMLWDAQTHLPVGQPLTGHSNIVWDLAFSSSGILASSSEDQTILLWDIEDQQGSIGQQLENNFEGISSVAFNPGGNLIAAASWDNTITLWNLDDSSHHKQSLIGHSDGVESVAFSPDGKYLASAGKDKNIIIWDLVTKQQNGKHLIGHDDVIESVAFSPNGQTLASASVDGVIILWSLTTNQPISQTLASYSSGVECVTFSPDGRVLASANWDNTIILWNLETEPPITQSLSGHTSWVHSVAFSPNGKHLASASADGSIIIWDTTNGEPIGQPLTGHGQEVNSVAYSPDGKLIGSGGRDNTIILWNASTGQPIGQPISGHTDWVWSVAFSPDSRSLVSGSADNTVIIWDVELKSWQDLACRKANRNLTQSEWEFFIGSDFPFRLTCSHIP